MNVEKESNDEKQVIDNVLPVHETLNVDLEGSNSLVRCTGNVMLEYYLAEFMSRVEIISKSGVANFSGYGKSADKTFVKEPEKYSTNRDINDSIRKALLEYHASQSDVRISVVQEGIRSEGKDIIAGLSATVTSLSTNSSYTRSIFIKVSADRIFGSFQAIKEGIKQVGCVITYFSRYLKMMFFGIGTEELNQDIDALIEDTSTNKKPISTEKKDTVDYDNTF